MAEVTEPLANVSLKPYTSLRAGGRAEWFQVAHSVENLATIAIRTQSDRISTTLLGSGSNVLPSDDGVPGLTILNRAKRIQISADGQITADTGCSFQELFLKSVQSGFRGLEFAVGIPGTLGGALVSNAGAYRSCVSEFLVDLEIVVGGVRQWVSPDWMQFSYRDSILRKSNPPQAVVLRVKMKLPVGQSKKSYDEAREYQRQRIGKQPPSPSAGSFFKNVNNSELANSLVTLPLALKMAGIVPAGYLIEAAGLKGHRVGGAALGVKHANFILNIDNASAYDIYLLAQEVKRQVNSQFGVELEEEVLYLGNWSRFLT